MEFQLPETTLLRVFSFLDAFSLLQATQVNKKPVSEDMEPPLLLQFVPAPADVEAVLPPPHEAPAPDGGGKAGGLCLQGGSWQPWNLESHGLSLRKLPTRGRTREVTPLHGVFKAHAFCLGCAGVWRRDAKRLDTPVKMLRRDCNGLREGTIVWSSPVQQSNIKFLATLPQLCLAFTVDTEETVKVWDCQHEEALAELTRPRISFSMEALLAKEDPFLMVGDSEGDICTLTVPGLEVVSIVNAFNHSVDLLHCSPDARWVLAAAIHQHILPQVFLAECLLRPGTRAALLSVSLPVVGCYAACWALRRANRVVVMFQRDPSKKTGFATFDVTTERIGDTAVIRAHQVESFTLPVHMESPVWMGVSDGTVIVLDSGPQLLLLTISGLPLQCFHDYELSICHLWVGPLYVVTTSMDNHLHLYMWEDKGRHPYLKSCCHLELRKGDQTPSCFLSKTICDEASIVCVVHRNLESSVLVMYSLSMCYGT